MLPLSDASAFAHFVTDGRRHIAEGRYWCADPNESWKYYVPREGWAYPGFPEDQKKGEAGRPLLY